MLCCRLIIKKKQYVNELQTYVALNKLGTKINNKSSVIDGQK